MKRLLTMLLALPASMAFGSSHREAPAISQDAPVDITDLYVFRTPGNETNSVSFVMNVYPAQVAASGPNWYRFADDARYEFNIDTTGDAVADVKYRFEFKTEINHGLPLAYLTANPLFGNLSHNGTKYSHGLTQNYKVSKVVLNGTNEEATAVVPNASVAPARVGPRTTDFGDPNADAANNPNADAAYKKNIQPSIVTTNGYKVFAGPRNDPFFVDLGGAFDLLGLRNPAPDALRGLNCLSIVIDVPVSEIFSGSNRIMGVWATTSRRQNTFVRAGQGTPTTVGSGGFVQVARLGNPLVNELVIGLTHKDLFNASQPKNDSQFANFVVAPALTIAMNTVLGGVAGYTKIRESGRSDLAVVFAQGVPGINQIAPNPPIADMLRINLGAATGFPNGRTLTDDIVDVALKVVAECSTKALGLPADLPTSQNLPLTSFNCKLSDNVAADDKTKGGSGITTDFPYVGLPHSSVEVPAPNAM